MTNTAENTEPWCFASQRLPGGRCFKRGHIFLSLLRLYCWDSGIMLGPVIRQDEPRQYPSQRGNVPPPLKVPVEDVSSACPCRAITPKVVSSGLCCCPVSVPVLSASAQAGGFLFPTQLWAGSACSGCLCE